MPAAASMRPGFRAENNHWREQHLTRLPRHVTSALRERVEQIDVTDYRAANTYLGETVTRLTAAHLHRAYDEQLIRDYGDNYARLCGRSPSLEKRRDFALAMGIEPPAGRSISPAGMAARLECPRWWRAQLRKSWTRAAENSMRELGFIRRGRAPYASNEAVDHRRAQKRRAVDFMQSFVAVNETTGEQLSLWDAHEHSISNPALRRGEFMCRARGFELIAKDMGHVAEFVTLTAPSAFHAQLAAAGANPAFQRQAVRDAQAWLCKMWARARAKLKRLSILFYGFRIAEPHHDATPHWHLLLFLPTSAADSLRAVLRAFWLSELSGEAGATDHRGKVERIDAAKGSATGYVAKYVSKNIHGKGAIANERDHESGTGVAEGIERVETWASVHGIRQFQQIGGPQVTLWREARRLRNRVDDPDIEVARQCADSGRWREFVQCVGGIHAGRRTNLKLLKVETGERDRYGDCKPARVIGLQWASAIVVTHPDRWRIEKKSESERRCAICGAPWVLGHRCKPTIGLSSFDSYLGPVSITVRDQAARVRFDGTREQSQGDP